MRLRFNLAKAEPEFIRHLLMTVGGRQRFLKALRRSAVQYNINTKEISALCIPILAHDTFYRYLLVCTETRIQY